ncbi:MAG: ABC transporter ATP-binding protein [Kiritimatiellae bacterium]|nr:ABC transporter ATP-binding protein [Kiritimatiellia bacterium]
MHYMIDVRNLSLAFKRDGQTIVPVRDVSFAVPRGGRVALVGESGCGKSLSALSLAGLPPTDRARRGGSMRVSGTLAYVFQNPMEALNPVMRIGEQIAENLSRVPRREREREILSLLARTGLPDPARAVRAYPCELSGGQQQRAMIAMALAARPDVLVCDEPTTALDVTTQKQVLSLIDTLAAETGMAVLFITHNLGLVAAWMDDLYVLYAGETIESGKVSAVLEHPRHPYTQGLLAAVPLLDAPRNAPLRDIPGTVPPPTAWPQGCAFAPRCPNAQEVCRTAPPSAHGSVRCHFA